MTGFCFFLKIYIFIYIYMCVCVCVCVCVCARTQVCSSWNDLVVAYTACTACSTMGVGCQSRRFNCLFWRETRQRILGHEISPYPEVVRGGEWELTTRPSRGVGSWTGERRVGGRRPRETVGGWRAERQAAEEKLAWKNGGAVNTGHRAERRGDKIGSSEEESQDVWSQ